MTNSHANKENISVSKHNNSLRKSWLHGAGIGVILQGLGLTLAFSSSILLARFLGPDGLGSYSYVLAIVSVLSVIATLGTPTVVARLLPAYQTKEEWGLARGLLSWCNFNVFCFSLAITIGLIIFGTFFVNKEDVWLYFLAAPLVIILALTNIRQRTLQGLHHPLAAQLPEQFIKHSTFLLLCGSVWFIHNDMVYEPQNIMFVWLIAGVVSLLSGILLLRKLRPVDLDLSGCQFEKHKWRTIASSIFIADILGVILGNIDTILLGLLKPAEEVGLYQIALRLSGLMLVLLGASNWVLAPWFSRFHSTGESERLQRIITLTTRSIFAATLFIFLLMVLVGKQFIGIFFGPLFVEAYPMMLILGVAQLVNVASGPVVNLLAMTGGQLQLAWGVGIAALVNILLCGVLIPKFGSEGAAIAVATTMSLYNIALARVVRERTGIGATIFG